MAIHVQYQNNITGEAYDIASLVNAVKWSTKRSGVPASLEMSVIPHKKITWAHGGVLSLLDDKRGLFYGYVVKTAQSDKEKIRVTAYDQTWYLKKNKETYVFTGKRADEIVKRVADDFKLKIGGLDNTGYIIPSLVADGQTLFDTILKALDKTIISTGKMFILWDDFGSLKLTEPSKLGIALGDNSLATAFSYESSIDSEVYNRIKLVKDNKETGKRDVYLFEDSKNMGLWGMLQEYKVVDEKMNSAQIKDRGGKMLELYNRTKNTFSITAISDLSVRAGKIIFINIASAGIKSFFLIEEATHNLINRTMTLNLKAV